MTPMEKYKRDGYLMLKNGFQFTSPFEWSEKSLKKIFDKGVDQYIGFLSAQAKLAFFQKMFLSNGVYAIFDFININPVLITSQPVLHIMSPSLRIPDGYYGTAAHQDWPSTQGSLDCVTVWIPLIDASIGNFPLEVIPGSHLGGLREGKLNGSILEVEADDKEFVPVECRAGDVIFMSGFLVHRTGKGNGFRVAVSQRFDNANEQTFIERGYPCAQKRVVSREIPWRPTAEQVVKVFT